MNIPAIQGAIGDWTYYITNLSFKQVSEKVERIDDKLHKSRTLSDLIQRSITENYKSIRQYILGQDQRFFNSLVLAVYDDYPKWKSLKVEVDEEEYHSFGVLEFPGPHKIFPVDGQHRVEGIKAALEENPMLAEETIPVIFIGHRNDVAGKERTRRLFSTLNRYAKPVTMDDIIALDEDDSIAIATRNLLENFNLFTDKRVTKSKNKAIPDTDRSSLTSIITLYQCNKELLKQFRLNAQFRSKQSLDEYLKFRPEEEEITSFVRFCESVWTSFSEEMEVIQAYLSSEEDQAAAPFRNKDNGGNLLFRPVGILPFIQAVIEIHRRSGDSVDYVLNKFDQLDLTLDQKPWRNVLWNPNEKTMIMGSGGLVKLLLIYLYGDDLIRPSEERRLIDKYADKTGFEGENKAGVLIDLIRL